MSLIVSPIYIGNSRCDDSKPMLSEVQQPLIVFRRLCCFDFYCRQNLIGIFNESTGSNATFNTIANMQNGYEGTQVGRTGDLCNGRFLTLVKNNIHNLSSASSYFSSFSKWSWNGGTAAINMVTETLIYNLSNTNSSFNGFIAGIRFQVVLRNLVNRNFIRSISVHSL
jgi:hypothetical protein